MRSSGIEIASRPIPSGLYPDQILLHLVLDFVSDINFLLRNHFNDIGKIIPFRRTIGFLWFQSTHSASNRVVDNKKTSYLTKTTLPTHLYAPAPRTAHQHPNIHILLGLFSTAR